MNLVHKWAAERAHAFALIKHQPHAIPGTAKKIRGIHGFQCYQRMFGHEFAIEREFHPTYFLSCIDGSNQGLLVFHFGFQLIRPDILGSEK